MTTIRHVNLGTLILVVFAFVSSVVPSDSLAQKTTNVQGEWAMRRNAFLAPFFSKGTRRPSKTALHGLWVATQMFEGSNFYGVVGKDEKLYLRFTYDSGVSSGMNYGIKWANSKQAEADPAMVSDAINHEIFFDDQDTEYPSVWLSNSMRCRQLISQKLMCVEYTAWKRVTEFVRVEEFHPEQKQLTQTENP